MMTGPTGKVLLMPESTNSVIICVATGARLGALGGCLLARGLCGGFVACALRVEAQGAAPHVWLHGTCNCCVSPCLKWPA